MNNRRTWVVVAVLSAAVLSLAAEQQGSGGVIDLGIDRGALPAPVDAVDGVKPLSRDGRVYIAGQPSREALARLHALGVTAVVNEAVYLIREQGSALPDALARGEAIAISPDPLEGLLGRPLVLHYADETHP